MVFHLHFLRYVLMLEDLLEKLNLHVSDHRWPCLGSLQSESSENKQIEFGTDCPDTYVSLKIA